MQEFITDKKIFAVVVGFLVLLQFINPEPTNGLRLAAIIAIIILFLVLIFLYSINANKKGKKSASFKVLFWSYVALVALFTIGSFVSYTTAELFSVAGLVYEIALYFVFYIVVFLLMSAGLYFIYLKKNRGIGAIFLVAVILIAYIYIGSSYAVDHFLANDEEIITAHGVAMLFNGTNPYASSISNIIYLDNLRYNTGYTITTNNSVVGNMDYPALFFLSFAPFYFLSQYSIQNMQQVDLPIQAFVFFVAMIFAVGYALDKKSILEPKPLLYIGLMGMATVVPSITTYLMFAVILLAYTELDSKYSWILLGIAASLQELLWVPVLLLIAYSYNTQGAKKGIRNLLGTALVFLVFNGYFIALNPAAYFHSLFYPLNGFLFPDSNAPVGYLLFANYNATLQVFPYLFGVALLGSLALLLYSNNKKAIPLLSMVPFIFSLHGLIIYYYFFMAMFVVILYSKQEKYSEGGFRKAINKNGSLRNLLAVFAALLVFVGGILAIDAHSSYVNGLNLSISGQQSYENGSVLHYNGMLHFDVNSTKRVYLLLQVYNGQIHRGLNVAYYGLDNTSLLSSSTNCSYPCSLNDNVIQLNSSDSPYLINATVYNVTAINPVYISAFLYNGRYAYQSTMIRVDSN
ncbi:MAG: hypothetical protein KGH64_01660 [Candidatus Micrarchaeota archaeon]|nr:hypothetical protein [Candidatus Micrarchaeota archaeon]MDE1859375.1 hypothetical protein [Candidatus Micrarchaeota archaeon]